MMWIKNAVTTLIGLAVVLVGFMLSASDREASLTLIAVGVALTSFGGSLLGSAEPTDKERGFGRVGVLVFVAWASASVACAQWSLRKSPSEWAACVIAAGQVAGEWIRDNPPLDVVKDALETAARLSALIQPCLEQEE